MKYTEAKNKQPDSNKCFWAFSNKQFDEGVKKKNLQGVKIYRGGHGLFGSEEGLKTFWESMSKISEEITEKCDPQEVYDYEFWNHESEYVGNDHEAIKIVVSYFGKEKAKKVNRMFGWLSIDDID